MVRTSTKIYEIGQSKRNSWIVNRLENILRVYSAAGRYSFITWIIHSKICST